MFTYNCCHIRLLITLSLYWQSNQDFVEFAVSFSCGLYKRFTPIIFREIIIGIRAQSASQPSPSLSTSGELISPPPGRVEKARPKSDLHPNLFLAFPLKKRRMCTTSSLFRKPVVVSNQHPVWETSVSERAPEAWNPPDRLWIESKTH